MPSLELPQQITCAFCDYLAGKRPYTTVWRDDQVAVLVTREQRGKAHLLVMPVAHVETLLDLPDALTQTMMTAVRNAAAVIDQAVNPRGIAVWQNNGVPAGQAIRHLHFHVAGTLSAGGTDFGKVPELSVAETDAIAAMLSPAVAVTFTAPAGPHET